MLSSSTPAVRTRHHNSPLYALEKISTSSVPLLSERKTPFLVLGIETSCDDTAAAVVRSDGVILSNVVSSQHQLHAAWGGVVPGLAEQAHRDRIDDVVATALKEAALSGPDEVDGIAVTRGPGLEICLRVGLKKAQALAQEYSKPLVAVHHLEAHCLLSRIALEGNEEDEDEEKDEEEESPHSLSHLPHCRPKVNFPFLTFLASGGHTSLLLCHDLGRYEVLGATVDDALGEALDKAARLLGLSTSFSGGGPAVEAAAAAAGERNGGIRFTVPLLRQRNCDFSYSGLKNGFRMAVMKARQQAQAEGSGEGSITASNAPPGPYETVEEQAVVLSAEVNSELCAAFQAAAFQHAVDRLHRAIGFLQDRQEETGGVPVSSLVICGGVAANAELRRRLQEVVKDVNESQTQSQSPPWRTFFPPAALCTDNGVMVAWAGVELFCRGATSSVTPSSLSSKYSDGSGAPDGKHEASLMEPIPRWTLGPHVNRNNDVVFRKRVKQKR